ncbi:bifunctional adenosylcobinamide kinase/adenosylcobinamide-phosphate guanylyltransferase [Psychrobacillus sp.]|uniref:bifunctional adenosylcobinamide kinase/adenosylcobinamide-phosphate guanylyltransferase n=1 Tax=Psychrobacillus sp. TaxID=1871623 RepID=UPI0028BE2F4F|nr:bifunctional adenosylcobinamide kinase/adenosylcobinamide-phosphate guanylyltransferase [Psychrobacillus sp.]
MHIIFGGAFNGKRAHVEKLLIEQDIQVVQWLDAAAEAPVLLPTTEAIVLSGVETVTESTLTRWIDQLESWGETVQVYVIATEIGRGIVPMSASLRILRDDVGRFYQQIFAKAEQVTRIWYGIPQTIKGR